MYIKRLINFFLEKPSGKASTNVRLRVKWNNSKSVSSFGIGIKVDADKWSYETQRCKNNTTHGKKKIPANTLNKEIQRTHDIAEAIFYDFEQKGTTPTVAEFKTAFNLRNGKQQNQNDTQDKSFFDIYDEYTAKQGVVNSWGISMNRKFNSLKLHLINFNNNISFDIINDDFMIEFIKYFQSKESMKIRYKDCNVGMQNTTISKRIVFLKMFLRWAKKNGHYHGDVHENFKLKLKGTDGNNKEVVHLTWNELIHLYNFKFENPAYEKAKDVFCFCCFSSLRYSDVQNLKKSDIKNDCINIVTQKTVEGLKIELNKYSKAILDKYKDNESANTLPVISNQNLNNYLKEICKTAEINDPQRTVYFIGNKRYEEVRPKYELITTHCGRRTFIVNALYLGIPAEVVMKWTGHSDYKSMKPYIKIVDELKRESMKKFDLKESVT